MDDLAISVCNISKCYQVFESQWSRLRNAFLPKMEKGVKNIWALQDINFEVRRGDAMAVIGRNGSGKSTLLEIITGTLSPTTGDVVVNGNIAALLELGSGFNPEYSGRENVFLNGMLLGLSRNEVQEHYDEILSFADIGDVLDRPVKTYSSGMLVRLAFAVQVALRPDILIVDEALSVGDYFFQQKCFGHLRKMRENGLTLLFVSHDMGTVRDLCSTAAYLREGKIQYFGDSKTAIQKYLHEKTDTDTKSSSTDLGENRKRNGGNIEPVIKNALWTAEGAKTGHNRIISVSILNEFGESITQATLGETIKVVVYFQRPPGEEGHISLIMKNRYDQVVTNIGSNRLGANVDSEEAVGITGVEIELDLMLEAGLYSLNVSYGIPTAANKGQRIDETGWIGPLQIKWDYDAKKAPFLGMFGLPARMKLRSANENREEI